MVDKFVASSKAIASLEPDARAEEGSKPEFLQAISKALDDFDVQDTSSYDACSAAAHVVAECCKVVGLREIHREEGTVKRICQCLIACSSYISKAPTSPIQGVLIECLRAVGNLCIDDDENREQVFEYEGAISAMTSLISSSDDKIKRTTCGALANLCMDSEPIQNRILSIKPLSELLPYLDTVSPEGKATPFEIHYFMMRLVCNLISCEVGIKEMLSGPGLKILMNVVKNRHIDLLKPSSDESFDEDLQLLEPLVAAMEAILENEDIQRKTLEENYMTILFDFVDHRPTHDLDKEQEHLYEEIHKTVTRMAALVTMHDVNMKQMANDPAIVKRFLTWAIASYGTPEESRDDKIRVAGCLCLGNLARSDETCFILTRNHNVTDCLSDVIRKETAKIDPKVPEMRGVIKVLHAATGTLKNLSLAPGNSEIIGKSDAIDAVSRLLSYPGLRPIQLNCIGIIRSLAVREDCPSNFYMIITGHRPTSNPIDLKVERPILNRKSPLSEVVKLINVATDESEAGIRNEGARLIASLFKICHKKGYLDLWKVILKLDGIPALIQVITGCIVSREHEESVSSIDSLDTAHVKFKLGAVEGPVYPIVQMEGILALVLVFDSIPHYINQILVFKDDLKTALQKIIDFDETANSDVSKNLQYDEHMKSNARILLSKIQEKE